MNSRKIFVGVGVVLVVCGLLWAADVVLPVIEQPGTQPQQVSNLESPDKCDNCHGGYNPLVEPAHNWRGSMMANAGRDPIFWATLAVAEQDFPSAGDLCIRCHSTAGWLGGRSTPTDGSGLAAGDSDGVECDFCHKLTNPNNQEYLGVQIDPYVANDGGNPAEGYYGSGMASIWGGSEKLGPYSDPVARHQFLKSDFHRSTDFCGTCHDVSNPAVGNLAPNYGAQFIPTGGIAADGVADGPVGTKAAFNNLPFMYGVVERTFSEHKASAWPGLPVDGYTTLPEELKTGAPLVAYQSASVADPISQNFADGTERYFTCQTCHMRPVEGQGCNKRGAPMRTDLPLHDMTGGNYWMPEAIKYLDSVGKLRLGGGLTATQIAALDDGAVRAKKQLSEAATIEVINDAGVDKVKVVNLTGHKLITGYPEGRRMWLQVRWFDAANEEIPGTRQGDYGSLQTTMDLDGNGTPDSVNTILNPETTTVYEAHYGITKAWAQDMITTYGFSEQLCLSYDRVTGGCDYRMSDLAALGSPDDSHETFHFVLNNTVIKDNRIPPYGFRYDEAQVRNALPVPDSQYGNPGSGGEYDFWDEVPLDPPAGAVYAEIDLLYQPTSWEYIQFLYLANDRSNAFLADEGVNMLEAWLAVGMAEPYVMTSTTWGNAPEPPTPDMWTDSLTTYVAGRKGQLTQTSTFRTQDSFLLRSHVVDESGAPLSGAQVFVEITGPEGPVALQGFSDDTGVADLQWRIPRNQAAGSYTATVWSIIKNGYAFNAAGTGAVTSVGFTIQ